MNQKNNTCRITKVPKEVYGKNFYEIRCKKKSQSHTADTTTLKEAKFVAKKMAKKHNIKKIYEDFK